MAVDFVKVDPALTPQAGLYGGTLLTLLVSLRATIDQLDRVKAVMDHSNDGVSFTQIETLFGLPSGKGQVVYDLINGTRGAIGGTMQNSNALSLIDRVG